MSTMGTRNLRVRDRFVWLGFLVPALAVYTLFLIYPVIQSGVLSFTSWSGPGRPATVVWFDNYAELLADPVFWQAMGNTFALVAVSIVIQLPIGLGLAMIVITAWRARRFWRAVYFIPTLMSTVAIGILWRLIYSPDFGVVNGILRAVGLGDLAQGWLGQSSTALAAVLLTNIWQWAPFYMVIFLAALAGINGEVYEAASLDGATAWQQFWHVTLPLLKPVILTTSILALAGSIKAFDIVYIMTAGGPSHSTELLATYMFQSGFTDYRLGYASTIAVVMFLITFVLTVIVLVHSNLRARAEQLKGMK